MKPYSQLVRLAFVRPLLAKDRKSTRLNSSHLVISYAVFCLKKKNKYQFLAPRVASHSTAGRVYLYTVHLHPLQSDVLDPVTSGREILTAPGFQLRWYALLVH